MATFIIIVLVLALLGILGAVIKGVLWLVVAAAVGYAKLSPGRQGRS